MTSNILSGLLPPNVDDYEILSIIQQHYHGSRSTPEGEIVYPNSDNYALKVRSDSGRITAIDPGPAFTDYDYSALKEKIKSKLIVSPGAAVEACFLFSSQPVKGQFRSSAPSIQILEPPP